MLCHSLLPSRFLVPYSAAPHSLFPAPYPAAHSIPLIVAFKLHIRYPFFRFFVHTAEKNGSFFFTKKTGDIFTAGIVI